MNCETRHFVAYHNTEQMGRSLRVGDPFRVLTNKRVDSLQGHLVWFVVGEDTRPRKYFLGSVFRVTEIGDTTQGGFSHFASGHGHVFEPPIRLDNRDWFPSFATSVGRFGFGLQALKDPSSIAALEALAGQAGLSVP